MALQSSARLQLNSFSVITSAVMGSLPTISATSFFNGGGPGSTGQLTTDSDFYTWFNETIIALMYQDAVCGDGVCSSPEEVPGVGRFGWSSPSVVIPHIPLCAVLYCLSTLSRKDFLVPFCIVSLGVYKVLNWNKYIIHKCHRFMQCVSPVS